MGRVKVGLIAVLTLLSGIVEANIQDNSKYQSLLMYNFAKYSEWGQEYKNGDFVIGVLGESDIYDHLSSLALNKRKGNQKIKVVKFKSHKEITSCHILFISHSNSDMLFNALKKVDKNNTLIVTEKSNMCKKGSDFNFVVKNNKLQFEMNRGTNSKANLKVSSELSKFAILI